MKLRVISGIIASVLAVIIIFSRKEIFDVACLLFSVAAVYEVFEAFGKKGFKPIRAAGYIACVCVFLGSIEYWDRRIWGWLRSIILFVDIRFLLYLSLLLMFFFLITGIHKHTVSDLAVTILGTFYICFLFWYLIMTRNLRAGEYAVLFVALAAVSTDTGAFIVGINLGKHKLIPDVSPNKTVEGAIGGVLLCTLTVTLYGMLVYDNITGQNPFWQYIVMGAVCGVIAQMGDLAASCLKRYCGIKDFGKIIPGHGGILDRMDSVILLSPLIHMLLTVMEKVS